MNKKEIRTAFRHAVFERDKYKCRICKRPGKCRQTGEFKGLDIPRVPLDAHHITNRETIVNGGYVKENGISLCDECHNKAESGEISPGTLYILIGSSKEIAEKASMVL